MFKQDINYQPYGEVIAALSTGVPGTTDYTSEQWNGGDALAALGLSQLGARMYDPVIGRFLSRDPLFDPNNLNAYAFAGNDPVNNSDPTGMEKEGPTAPPSNPCGVISSCGPGPSGPLITDSGDGSFWDVPRGIGHEIRCIFADCGGGTPEPNTSTTSSDGKYNKATGSGAHGLSSTVSSKPTTLRHYVGTEDYYSKRHADFVRRHPGVEPPDYYLEYGDRNVRKFNALKLSPYGNLWVKNTTALLQKATEDLRDRDPVAFDALEQNGEDFRDFSFDIHPRAYIEGGLADVTVLDLVKIINAVGIGNMSTASGLKQAIITGTWSLITPNTREKENFRACGTTHCK